MRPVAVVIGAGQAGPELTGAAEELGRGLVEAGFRVATGGLGGVMQAASKGARQAPSWTEGSVVGVLPGAEAGSANPYVDIAVPTNMGTARNVILVHMAQVVIAVGGGSGTLSELALAWQHGKPIVALDLGQGWSAELADRSLDGRREDRIHRATSAAQAVALARSLAPTRA